MTRYTMAQTKISVQSEQKSSIPMGSEGEAARILLEANGYRPKSKVSNGQYELACPFHEQHLAYQPWPRGHSTNFYLDKHTSKYFCQAASCGEKGNLRTLEKFFGVANDPTSSARYITNEERLKEWESQLPRGSERRQVFYDAGLRDDIIDRFRFGYDQERAHYVLPYLEGRRPIAFRFYDPNPEDHPRLDKDGNPLKNLKYWWEKGTESIPFNLQDSIGDRDGRVFITEGEKKAALLCQLGFCAVGLPGANTWKREWSQDFNHVKEIFILLDNDNPDFHQYSPCNKCGTELKEECQGHNPGQDCAIKLMDIFGLRARNIVLPLPEGERKTDINEYFMRDGKDLSDFMRLVFPESAGKSQFLVRTLSEIRAEPPEEAVFLVDQGLLPRGGRLLVTGAPKAGKSIFVENLALSIAAGIPFLGRFRIAENTMSKSAGHRVLLLDRELSDRSLFDRFDALIEARPGYAAAEDKLLIDHRVPLRLDQPNAVSTLINLVNENAADVIILDTAYKFFSGDLERSSNVSTALASLDECITETGVSVILTHHHRKKSGNQNGKEMLPDPDQVVGTFLWTGWPNGTVLLNFLDRRVESPFNTICSFAAFRDAAPPEPLTLYRDRTSIAYKSVVPYVIRDDEDDHGADWKTQGLSFNTLQNALLEAAPIAEETFLNRCARIWNVKPERIKYLLLDIADRSPDFVRTGRGNREDPYIWKYKYEPDEEPFQEEELQYA